MESTEKETRIQRAQNIIASIDKTAKGLKAMYDYFDGDYETEDINRLEIYDGEAADCDHEAKRVNEVYLPDAVKDAHNMYVALLVRWREIEFKKLNQDLITA